VAGGDEEDQEESGAVYAWPMEEIGKRDEGEDEERTGIRRDEQQREPANKGLETSPL
jgi:hypothetical protein